MAIIPHFPAVIDRGRIWPYNRGMIRRFLPLVLILALFAMPARAEEKARFFFQNRSLEILTRNVAPRHSRLILRRDGESREISRGIGGINHHPRAAPLGDFFLIAFHNFREGRARLYLYDSRDQSTRALVDIPGFKFISPPVFFPAGQPPKGIVFLGNRSDNDDLFYLDLRRNTLCSLTDTPVSEKKFWILSDFPLRIRTRTLYRETVIEFDPRSLSVTSRRHRPLVPGRESDRGSLPIREPEENDYYRTFIAFGDSITAGKMKTETLPNGYYPELAYPCQTERILSRDYTGIGHLALGVPGEDTYEATFRIHQVLGEHPGKYFFYLEGTNDVWIHTFSVDSSLENIEYNVDAALADGRAVIMASVPPRKLPLIAMENIRELNRGIRRMAAEKGLPCVEIFNTFMGFPEGWESLMEDTDKKNHPNPRGHEIIADLLAAGILDVPPQAPVVQSLVPLPYYRYEVRWSECPDFDHDHYLVEYGHSPGSYLYQVPVFDTRTILTLIPYDNLVRDIYFRLRAIDDTGRWSEPSGEYHLGL